MAPPLVSTTIPYKPPAVDQVLKFLKYQTAYILGFFRPYMTCCSWNHSLRSPISVLKITVQVTASQKLGIWLHCQLQFIIAEWYLKPSKGSMTNPGVILNRFVQISMCIINHPKTMQDITEHCQSGNCDLLWFRQHPGQSRQGPMTATLLLTLYTVAKVPL